MGKTKDISARSRFRYQVSSILSPLSLLILLYCLLGLACVSKPTDMRTLVPAETLVYLETDDLAAALQPIVDNKAFLEVAKSKPDFSTLKGVQLAVAVTGFETSEEKLTDEHSVGRVQPHFVAVADTHSWNYQAVGFAEKKLGAFVTEIYDSEPALEKSDKNGGKYFTWKAKDGRKAYALVIDSLIYFGNDETAIDKCLTVRRGETDSIAKAGKVVPSVPGTLASGYIGPNGIAQISNLIALKFASEMGEDSEVQSAIAGILPQLLRNSITEISWTARKTEQGIEDKYSISFMQETTSVLKETLSPASQKVSKRTIAYIPPDVFKATRYNLQSPQIAWRSLLLVAGKGADAMTAKILIAFSGSLFEAYGITDPETFLGAVDPEIWTVNFDADGEKTAVVVSYKSNSVLEQLKKSVTEIDFKKPFESAAGGVSWTSEDKEMTFLLASPLPGNNILIVGNSESVQKCREANLSYLNKEANPQFRGFYDKFAEDNNMVAVTYGKDSPEKTIEVLSEVKAENTRVWTNFTTETRFNANGMERRTTSDFGLIGSIIAQLADN